MSCFHQVFDLQYWSEVFPLDRLRHEAREFVPERHRTSPENYSDEAGVERHVELMLWRLIRPLCRLWPVPVAHIVRSVTFVADGSLE